MRRDELARFLPHDAFSEMASASAVAAAGSGQPASIVALSIDGFSELQAESASCDTDVLMGQLVELISRNLRSQDVATEGLHSELLVLLPDTPPEAAREAAERLVGAVRNHGAWRCGGSSRPLSLSAGVASAPHHGTDCEEVLSAARAARAELQGNGGDGAALAHGPRGTPYVRRLDVDRFTGRADHLRSLVKLLDDATVGAPRLVTISGDVGIGASALARQLTTEVRLRGGSMIAASCRSLEIAPAYGLWVSILEQLHRQTTLPRRTWFELPGLYPPLVAGGAATSRGGSQYRLFGELSQLIRAVASQRPLVLLLEEMQFADAASLDALEHVLSELGSARVLCCLTYRTPDRGVQGESAERRARPGRLQPDLEIHLSRLTREEVKTWVEAAFHHQEVGRELLAFIYRHTEGNPLFVFHLLRALEEEGAVSHDGKEWKWRAVSELRMPARLDALLARRLERLSAEARPALLAAAVHGGKFDVSLIAAAGAIPDSVVAAHVRDCVAAGLLEPAGERGSGSLSFTHSAIAETIAAIAEPEQRQSAHLGVAAALDSRGGEDPGTVAIHHDRGGSGAAAYHAAMLAARRADRLYAPSIADEYLRLAARNASSPAELAEARVNLATIAERMGRYEEAEELCDLAIDWYTGQEDRERSIVLRRVRERVRSQLGQPAQRTLDSLSALDSEAAALELDAERVAILTLLSQTYGRLGDRREAERIAAECVAMAERLGDASLLADSLNRYAITLDQEEWRRAQETYHRVLRLYEQAADTRGQARVYINLGVLLQIHGQLHAAEEALSKALTIARTAGLPDQWGLASLNLGVMVMNCGDHDRARELFSESLRLFAAVKNGELQLYALYNLAHLERNQGLFDSAAGLYEVAASLAGRVGQADVELGAIAGAGYCRYADGKPEEARTALGVVESRLGGRDDWFQGRELIEALRLASALEDGDDEGARAIFESAIRLAEEGDLYGGAWLAATMGPLIRSRGIGVGETENRIRTRARELGLDVTERTNEASLSTPGRTT
jgi:diguanylate cyclase (GGDEF)-like protein